MHSIVYYYRHTNALKMWRNNQNAIFTTSSGWNVPLFLKYALSPWHRVTGWPDARQIRSLSTRFPTTCFGDFAFLRLATFEEVTFALFTWSNLTGRTNALRDFLAGTVPGGLGVDVSHIVWLFSGRFPATYTHGSIKYVILGRLTFIFGSSIWLFPYNPYTRKHQTCEGSNFLMIICLVSISWYYFVRTVTFGRSSVEQITHMYWSFE